MADALVRPADDTDAPTLAELQLQAWRQAYADLLPPAVLQASAADLTPAWRHRLAGPGRVLLAFEGHHPVGLAAVAGTVDEAGRGEIELLLVLPRFARRGHGGRLLAAAAGALRAINAGSAVWWAPESDRSVERFLAGTGWQPDGGRRVLDTGSGHLTELRYAGPVDLTVA